MNRRDFLIGASALTALAPFTHVSDAAAAGGTCVVNPPVIDKPVKPQVAASMKRLLAEAKTGARPRLVNMTRIDGYTVTEDDLVLWGRSEPKESELLFDDLVIAFKSIRGAYGGGIPGVDLSWKPDGTENEAQKWTRHASRDAAIPYEDEHAYEQFCAEVATFPIVTALPRNSQLTKTLLDADWTMKAIGIGTKPLRVKNPFQGHYTAAIDARRKTLLGKASQAEKDEVDQYFKHAGRAWFHPGRMSYVRDEGSVFIDCVQVLLSVRNKDGAGNDIDPNPLLQRFACSWSNRMDEITATDPEWKYMRSVFRTFALARIIDQKQDTFRLADREVIDNYPVMMTSVPSKYPHVVKFASFPYPSKGGPYIKRMRMCGGVRINDRNTERTQDPAPSTASDVTLSGRKALDSMRSCTDESCWKVE